MSCNFSRLFMLAAVMGIVAISSQNASAALPGMFGKVKQAQINKAMKQNQNHASDQTITEALHVLGSVEHTLKHADHDYGGHRADAMHAISAAEKQLRLIHHHHHKHHKTQPKVAKTGNKGNGGVKGEPELQAVSDQHLLAQIPKLHAAAHFISQANHDFGGHRAKAIKDIHHAIGQLQTALKYSAVKNQGKN
jgi:hypothetical protein